MASFEQPNTKTFAVIKNHRELLKGSSHIQQARFLVLEFLEAALNAADPRTMVQRALHLKGSTLQLSNHQINLNETNGVYVVGAGKATGRMAEALEQILNQHITDGLIIVPSETIDDFSLNHIKIWGGGHPIPTKQSITATKAIQTLIQNSPKDALIISLFSGGGSALFTHPTSSITLQDLQKTTTNLLQAGVPIDGINAIRKHLSQVKGGQFSLQVHPRPHWALYISDVPGDHLDMIASGPTLPDSTTFQTINQLLIKFKLWKKLPRRVRDHFKAGLTGTIQETPKPDHPAFAQVVNQLIGGNQDACIAAYDLAQQRGIRAQILSTDCQGEARHVGERLGTLAQQLTTQQEPQAIIIGSETTVTLRHQGKGGRNTELTAAAIPYLHHDTLVLASLATDGIDGPTPYAGAIIDANSLTRAKTLGLSPEALLNQNDTFTLFQALKDHIETGPTHTNVRDITVILYLPKT